MGRAPAPRTSSTTTADQRPRSLAHRPAEFDQVEEEEQARDSAQGQDREDAAWQPVNPREVAEHRVRYRHEARDDRGSVAEARERRRCEPLTALEPSCDRAESSEPPRHAIA